MLKIKVTLLGVMALLITSGAMASTASALVPSWKVNGFKLGAQVKKQIKSISRGSTLKGKVAGTSVTIECSNVKAENEYIEGNSTGAGQGGTTGITFAKCTTALPNCNVVEPIKTTQLKAHLITLGVGQGKIGGLVEPSQGEEFTSIEFKNKSETEKCAIAGTKFPIKGKIAAEGRARMQEGSKQEPLESVIGEVVQPLQPITKVKLEGREVEVGLSVGANPGAVVSGVFETQLVGGEQFGAFYG